MAIDPRADRPVYKQLADEMRRRIQAGELPAGVNLPSEPELSTHYGMSRTSVRQSLTLLKNEGLISSKQGSGWYVRSQRPVRQMAGTRYQAELDHDRQGFEEFTLKKRFSEVPADDELAEMFAVPVGTMLLRREFTFLFDGAPHRKSQSYLLLGMVAGTPIVNPDNEPWPGGTIAQLDSVGVTVTAVEELVRGRMPSPEEISELDIDDGVPVLAVTRTMYAGERPVEACVDIVMPADRVLLRYRTELTDPRKS